MTPIVKEKSQYPSVGCQVRRDSRDKNDKNTQGIKCHECTSFGHIGLSVQILRSRKEKL
jgi:hypothetical protein